jgi:lipoprotein NlpD
MKPSLAARCVVIGACVALLAACGQSRVVRRDYESRPASSSRTTASRPASRAAAQVLPADGVHVVRRGETLYGISFRYGLRYQDVAAWNGIGDPYTIEIGQRLRLRPGGAPVASNPPRNRPPATAPSVRSPSAPTVAGSPGTSSGTPVGTRSPSSAPTVSGSAPTPPATTTRPPGAANPTVPLPTPAAGPAPAWRWPTRGQIIGRFVAGDRTQQGINIGGSAGQPILAAADGVVVYSGAGLVGYGELVIIKHSDEWLSAYAHNRKRLVAEGARVKAGDTIAEMGRTSAIRDMLHFEIRRNGKPVDPMVWLPRD